MQHVTTSMDVTSWDEKAVSEDSAGKITRTTMGQSCTGDFQGNATSELVMCYRPDATADIVGYLTINGTIGDRTGAIVFRSVGRYDGNETTADLSVVEGSGRDQFSGVTGTGHSVAPHGPTAFVELDLVFPPATNKNSDENSLAAKETAGGPA